MLCKAIDTRLSALKGVGMDISYELSACPDVQVVCVPEINIPPGEYWY